MFKKLIENAYKWRIILFKSKDKETWCVLPYLFSYRFNWDKYDYKLKIPFTKEEE